MLFYRLSVWPISSGTWNIQVFLWKISSFQAHDILRTLFHLWWDAVVAWAWVIHRSRKWISLTTAHSPRRLSGKSSMGRLILIWCGSILHVIETKWSLSWFSPYWKLRHLPCSCLILRSVLAWAWSSDSICAHRPPCRHASWGPIMTNNILMLILSWTRAHSDSNRQILIPIGCSKAKPRRILLQGRMSNSCVIAIRSWPWATNPLCLFEIIISLWCSNLTTRDISKGACKAVGSRARVS